MKSQCRASLALLPIVLSAACAASPQFPTKPPAPAAVAPAAFPPFRQMALENGLRIVVVERATQPVVSVALAAPAGSRYDPQGKHGLAGLTATLLTRGAGDRSAEDVSGAIEGVGGSLNASAGSDNLLISATVLTSDLPLAMDLLGTAVTAPRFPAAELELLRGQSLQGLQFQLSNAGAVADRVLRRRLYGEHPYGALVTATSLRSITREDVTAFHRQRIRPDGSTLVFAGDITLEEARRLAEEFLGSWSGRAPAIQPTATPVRTTRSAIVLVDRPGSVQSNLAVGNLTGAPAAEGVYAATVANEVLGVPPQGRLFQILREQHGWTYGASSSFDKPLEIGSFRAVAAVRNEVADSALVELLAQLRRIGREPVTQQELENARTGLVGRFPLQVETAQQVAGQVLDAILKGLPEDHLRNYRARLSAVTAEDAQRAAAEWIRPDEAVIVVVGDAAAIEDDLRAIGEVTVVDTDGVPVDRAAASAAAGYELNVSALVPRRDSMSVIAQGNTVGWQRSLLERTDDGWRYVEEAHIGAMVQQRTELLFTEHGRMRALRQTGSAGGQQIHVEADYSTGRVTGTARMPGQQETAVEQDVPENVLDDNAITALIPAFRWAPSAVITVPQFSAARNAVALLTLRVAGTEDVTVPAGTFEAYRVEMSGGAAPVTMFVATTEPHRLLKVVPSVAPVEIVLVR